MRKLRKPKSEREKFSGSIKNHKATGANVSDKKPVHLNDTCKTVIFIEKTDNAAAVKRFYEQRHEESMQYRNRGGKKAKKENSENEVKTLEY